MKTWFDSMKIIHIIQNQEEEENNFIHLCKQFLGSQRKGHIGCFCSWLPQRLLVAYSTAFSLPSKTLVSSEEQCKNATFPSFLCKRGGHIVLSGKWHVIRNCWVDVREMLLKAGQTQWAHVFFGFCLLLVRLSSSPLFNHLVTFNHLWPCSDHQGQARRTDLYLNPSSASCKPYECAQFI